jgi:uncharacterized protein (DUF2062 family)
MANTFKKVIDRMMWVQVAPAPNAHAAGSSMCADMRSDVSRNPFVYNLISNTVLNRFNIVTKAWQLATNPTLAGTFGVGSTCAFVPSFAAVGTIAAGATASSFTLATALPSAVGVNMLANRGGSGEYGFKIRIIDTVAGKTEERFIVANTGGTTPLIRLDNPLTFTPATGARYELLSGRVMMLGALTLAAGSFRSFEVATNTLASLGTVNLPASITVDSSFAALDEQYTPYDCEPGEGMIKGAAVYDTNIVSRNALVATASGASSLTGQASAGDAVVAANEFRNFQIRIVQDATTPASVGQRRIIASHTAGPSAVYTLGTAWTTQPSASARFVIEYPNLLLLRTSGVATVFTYNYTDAVINNGTGSIAANAWSTTYFAAAPAVNAVGGMWMQSFGIRPDPLRNARHSHCYFWRGSAVTLDLLDIAAAATGTWSAAIVYDGGNNAPGAGATGCYSPYGQEGRMFYANIYVASSISQIFRFDVQNRVLSPYTPTDWIQAGAATAGGRMAAYVALDGADKYDVVLLQAHLSTVSQELIPLV